MNSIAEKDHATLGIGQISREIHQNASAGGRKWPARPKRCSIDKLRILRKGVHSEINSILVRNWSPGELNITLAPDKAALSAPPKGDTRAPLPSTVINDMTWRRAA